jgi:hypothetical protein
VIVYSSGVTRDEFSFDLPYSLNFPPSESWKVALTEMAFPALLFNLRNDFLRFQDARHTFKILIPDGFYTQTRDIIRNLRSLWREYRIPGRFSYPRFRGGKLELIIKPYQTLTLSRNLAELLELPESVKNTNEDNISIKSSSFLNDKETNEHICVLVDFVEESMLGNVMMPVVSTLTIEKDRSWGGKTDPPVSLEYLPVKPGLYDKIKVSIKRVDGRKVKSSSNYMMLKFNFFRA